MMDCLLLFCNFKLVSAILEGLVLSTRIPLMPELLIVSL